MYACVEWRAQGPYMSVYVCVMYIVYDCLTLLVATCTCPTSIHVKIPSF